MALPPSSGGFSSQTGGQYNVTPSGTIVGGINVSTPTGGNVRDLGKPYAPGYGGSSGGYSSGGGSPARAIALPNPTFYQASSLTTPQKLQDATTRLQLTAGQKITAQRDIMLLQRNAEYKNSAANSTVSQLNNLNKRDIDQLATRQGDLNKQAATLQSDIQKYYNSSFGDPQAAAAAMQAKIDSYNRNVESFNQQSAQVNQSIAQRSEIAKQTIRQANTAQEINAKFGLGEIRADKTTGKQVFVPGSAGKVLESRNLLKNQIANAPPIVQQQFQQSTTERSIRQQEALKPLGQRMFQEGFTAATTPARDFVNILYSAGSIPTGVAVDVAQFAGIKYTKQGKETSQKIGEVLSGNKELLSAQSLRTTGGTAAVLGFEAGTGLVGLGIGAATSKSPMQAIEYIATGAVIGKALSGTSGYFTGQAERYAATNRVLPKLIYGTGKTLSTKGSEYLFTGMLIAGIPGTIGSREKTIQFGADISSFGLGGRIASWGKPNISKNFELTNVVENLKLDSRNNSFIDELSISQNAQLTGTRTLIGNQPYIGPREIFGYKMPLREVKHELKVNEKITSMSTPANVREAFALQNVEQSTSGQQSFITGEVKAVDFGKYEPRPMQTELQQIASKLINALHGVEDKLRVSAAEITGTSEYLGQNAFQETQPRLSTSYSKSGKSLGYSVPTNLKQTEFLKDAVSIQNEKIVQNKRGETISQLEEKLYGKSGKKMADAFVGSSSTLATERIVGEKQVTNFKSKILGSVGKVQVETNVTGYSEYYFNAKNQLVVKPKSLEYKLKQEAFNKADFEAKQRVATEALKQGSFIPKESLNETIQRVNQERLDASNIQAKKESDFVKKLNEVVGQRTVTVQKEKLVTETAKAKTVSVPLSARVSFNVQDVTSGFLQSEFGKFKDQGNFRKQVSPLQKKKLLNQELKQLINETPDNVSPSFGKSLNSLNIPTNTFGNMKQFGERKLFPAQFNNQRNGLNANGSGSSIQKNIGLSVSKSLDQLKNYKGSKPTSNAFVLNLPKSNVKSLLIPIARTNESALSKVIGLEATKVKAISLAGVKTLSLTKTVQRTVTMGRFNYNFKMPSTGLGGGFSDESKKRFAKEGRGYDVLVKEEGTKRYIQATKSTSLPKRDAIIFGEAVADNSLGASFYLRKSGKPLGSFQGFGGRDYKFRFSKKPGANKVPVYVEKESFRLDTPNEVAKIHAARVAALYRKSIIRNPNQKNKKGKLY